MIVLPSQRKSHTHANRDKTNYKKGEKARNDSKGQ